MRVAVRVVVAVGGGVAGRRVVVVVAVGGGVAGQRVVVRGAVGGCEGGSGWWCGWAAGGPMWDWRPISQLTMQTG